MGLQEKRAIQEFRDKLFPNLVKEIETIAGFKLDMEVSWDELASEGEAGMYNDAFQKVYFLPIIEAFKNICADEMGQKALQGALKKVKLCNQSHKCGTYAVTFSQGVLKIDHLPTTNIFDVQERVDAILNTLGKAL